LAERVFSLFETPFSIIREFVQGFYEDSDQMQDSRCPPSLLLPSVSGVGEVEA
jgi:hypothetical protein